MCVCVRWSVYMEKMGLEELKVDIGYWQNDKQPSVESGNPLASMISRDLINFYVFHSVHTEYRVHDIINWSVLVVSTIISTPSFFFLTFLPWLWQTVNVISFQFLGRPSSLSYGPVTKLLITTHHHQSLTSYLDQPHFSTISVHHGLSDDKTAESKSKEKGGFTWKRRHDE